MFFVELLEKTHLGVLYNFLFISVSINKVVK